jgi:hypothetical protein
MKIYPRLWSFPLLASARSLEMCPSFTSRTLPSCCRLLSFYIQYVATSYIGNSSALGR